MQFKNLLQQLHPLFGTTPNKKTETSATRLKRPCSTSKKKLVVDMNSLLVENRACKVRKTLEFGNGGVKSTSSSSSSSSISSGTVDSGLDCYYEPESDRQRSVASNNCKYCLHKANQCNEMKKKLKQAHINYVKSNLNENYFANIPLLVVRSYRPSLNSANKLAVRKGTPINALYTIDNKWIYVKTSSEAKGFIPKKCCEPFATQSDACTHRPPQQPQQLNNPIDRTQDHTYVSIDHLKKPTRRVTSGHNLRRDKKSLSNMRSARRLRLNASKFNQLAKSSSRNRKVSVAIDDDQFSSRLKTLTMLEEEKESEYENLTSFKQQQSDEWMSEESTTNPYCNLNEISTCSSITTISPLRNEDNIKSVNHYDILMTYNSSNTTSRSNEKRRQQQIINTQYQNNCVSLYRIVDNYQAKYKQDLTVHKNDLVYLIDESTSRRSDSNEWLFVRLYKRSKSSTDPCACKTGRKIPRRPNDSSIVYENMNNDTNMLSFTNDHDYDENSGDEQECRCLMKKEDINSQLQVLQGYVPRSHAIKLTSSRSSKESNQNIESLNYYSIYN